MRDDSYPGCKRETVYVVIDNSGAYQRTLDFIRDKYLLNADEVTVFAYLPEEKESIQNGSNGTYTVGKSEATNCN